MSIAIRVIVAVLQLSFCAANKSWQLLHSLDSGKSFSSRGTVSLALNDAGEVEISVANADSCLDLQTVNSLAGGLYQIKLIKDNDESTAVLTSVPACQVRRANFRDEMTVTLNSQADAVSVSYTPLVSPLAPKCQELSPLDEVPTFKSTITFETATPGMLIPTLLPPTKPPVGLKFFARSQGAADIPGITKPATDTGPKGILMKYWYIILPIFIMMMTAGGEEPPRGAAGPGGTATPVAAVAASAGEAAPSNGKSRRGKRGTAVFGSNVEGYAYMAGLPS